MRYPEFLPDNGTIGFIAPSFGCAIEPYKTCFDHALDHFREMGYRTKLGPNCYASAGVGISNTPELCGKELNEMYADPETDILMTCGGGELMCEVVPEIDWELIRRVKPKWYMGYSDNTNFTFLSTILADTAAIYGYCAPSFGQEPKHASIRDAFDLLKGKTTVHNYPQWEKESLKSEENPTATYNVTEEYRQRIFLAEKPQNAGAGELRELDKAAFEGRLIGGCVDILVTLLGTRFDKTADFLERYKEDGIIWFLECCDLNPLSIRRAFFQMREAGWFKYTKGFLIGRPLHFDEDIMGVDRLNAVTSMIGELGVPMIMDLDIGHLPPQMPLISGAYAKVDAKDNTIVIEHEFR